MPAALQVRGGSDAARPSRARSHGGASHAARGRGRTRVYAITLDTTQIGDCFRNLTTWDDPTASRLAFAIGNACFASFFIGRRAVALLWFAFVVTFLLPLCDNLQSVLEGMPMGEMLGDLLGALRAGYTMVRERFAPTL